jgi:sugar/nucleoside kinase (ribokinase family)
MSKRPSKQGKKLHLVTVGHVGYDNPHTMHGKRKIAGGAAYFAAKGASRFSKRLGVVTRVGRDFDLQFLKGLGISLDGVKVIKTGRSFQWHSRYDPKFNVVRSRGELNVGARISPKDIPAGFLTAKHIHIATMPPRLQIRLIEHLRAQGCRAKISIDTISDFIKQSPKEVIRAVLNADIVFLNEREFSMLTKFASMEEKMVVRKRGEQGAEIHHKGKRIRAKAPKVKVVVDTTGAGDVLAGVFLTLLARGRKPKEALKEAVKVASESIREFGVEHL